MTCPLVPEVITYLYFFMKIRSYIIFGARWSSGSAFDCRSRDPWFEWYPGLGEFPWAQEGFTRPRCELVPWQGGVSASWHSCAPYVGCKQNGSEIVSPSLDILCTLINILCTLINILCTVIWCWWHVFILFYSKDCDTDRRKRDLYQQAENYREIEVSRTLHVVDQLQSSALNGIVKTIITISSFSDP